jgi:hypothetical protein
LDVLGSIPRETQALLRGTFVSSRGTKKLNGEEVFNITIAKIATIAAKYTSYRFQQPD